MPEWIYKESEFQFNPRKAVPKLKGTNRKLVRQYRLSPTGGPNEGMLTLIVNLFFIGDRYDSTHLLHGAGPVVWGVSILKPKKGTQGTLELDSGLASGKSRLAGYQEIKHHFFTEGEAKRYYELIVDEWDTP